MHNKYCRRIQKKLAGTHFKDARTQKYLRLHSSTNRWVEAGDGRPTETVETRAGICSIPETPIIGQLPNSELDER